MNGNSFILKIFLGNESVLNVLPDQVPNEFRKSISIQHKVPVFIAEDSVGFKRCFDLKKIPKKYRWMHFSIRVAPHFAFGRFEHFNHCFSSSIISNSTGTHKVFAVDEWPAALQNPSNLIFSILRTNIFSGKPKQNLGPQVGGSVV